MFNYNGYKLTVSFESYTTDPASALVLEDGEGELFEVVSTNLPGLSSMMRKDIIFVPIYKFEGLIEALLEQEILIDPEFANYYQDFGEFKLYKINLAKVDKFVGATYDAATETLSYYDSKTGTLKYFEVVDEDEDDEDEDEDDE